MNINFQQNYFELFNLPIQFNVSISSLAKNYRLLQSRLHPDRFANASAQERRWSIQNTAFVNEAYNILKKRRLRGRYLLELSGIKFDDSKTSTFDPLFLMQQMELRETLAEAKQADDPLDELAKVKGFIHHKTRNFWLDFEHFYQNKDFKAAKSIVLKTRFCERILDEIQQTEEQLEIELLY